MSAVTISESHDAAIPDGVVVFTPRGEAALDQLAAVLTAHCSGTPGGIVKVLDQVMHADMNDLAEALSAIAEAPEHRAHPSPEGPDVECPHVAAHRRLGRPEAVPAVDEGRLRGFSR